MGEGRYSIDVRHGCLIMQRQHLKRWSTNLWAEAKMIKRDTIALIEDLDKKSETQRGTVTIGRKDTGWMLSWSKFTKKRNYTGNRGVTTGGLCMEMQILPTFTLVPMGGGGKQEYVITLWISISSCLALLDTRVCT
jgi:hypothetical protein